MSVFNRSGLRFVRNRTKAINLTTFHCVYPKKDIFADISVDLLFAYLISNTAKIIFEDNAREYANGLQKFEPNDLNKGMMLDLNLLSDKQKQEIERLYIDNIHSRSLGFIESIDDILISRFAL